MLLIIGAIPHFIDSDENTLGVNPESLKDWLMWIAEPTHGYYRNKSGRRLSVMVLCIHLDIHVKWKVFLKLQKISNW